MRADRLISILMLLQTRGKMTARALAETLEVSERTIYRDVEALGTSGVPVYADHGPGGGLALLDSYRTNLTGLDDNELAALFMLMSVPGPLEKLGAGQDLKSAVLKLSAALSDPRRMSEEQVRQRFLLDWSWWFHAQEPVPHLSTLQQAVWQGCCLRLRYRTYLQNPTEVEVGPLGLVAKAGVWYLVAELDGKPRVYRVSWLTDVKPLESPARRPVSFDLAAFWQDWCAVYEENQQSFKVTLRVSPELLRLFPLYFGPRVLSLVSTSGPPDAEGWVTLNLVFESFEAARDRILGFGCAAEVLEPEALRYSVIDYAEQTIRFYRSR